MSLYEPRALQQDDESLFSEEGWTLQGFGDILLIQTLYVLKYFKSTWTAVTLHINFLPAVLSCGGSSCFTISLITLAALSCLHLSLSHNYTPCISVFSSLSSFNRSLYLYIALFNNFFIMFLPPDALLHLILLHPLLYFTSRNPGQDFILSFLCVSYLNVHMRLLF